MAHLRGDYNPIAAQMMLQAQQQAQLLQQQQQQPQPEPPKVRKDVYKYRNDFSRFN